MTISHPTSRIPDAISTSLCRPSLPRALSSYLPGLSSGKKETSGNFSSGNDALLGLVRMAVSVGHSSFARMVLSTALGFWLCATMAGLTLGNNPWAGQSRRS